METVKSKDDALYLLNFTVDVQKKVKSPTSNHYLSFEDLTLREGKWYEPRQLPYGYRVRPLGYCFMNAYWTSIHYNVEYVEGFAATWTGLHHHAWNLDQFGRVVDTTWHNIRDNEPAIAYMGIQIPFPIVELATDLHKHFGVFDDVAHCWPILHYKLNWEKLFAYLKQFEVVENVA